ncbi:MAG: anthranilate synthase component I family protein, partial [Epsilonproteobacteria bacterium]|nr:anthranilate synthase component I family protein [Campylobacterota bacterium]
MLKTFLFDELTPVALYGELKKIFKDEITMLFESVVNTSDGNFSFITIGAKERIFYKNGATVYIDENKASHNLNISPFEFLKSYYAKIDKNEYIKKAELAGFSFTDGFIGFIGYDMVKVFEPVLKESMDNLEDTLNTPDLDLIRPKIIIGFSHKNSMLTIINNANDNDHDISKIQNILKQSHTPTSLKKADLKEGKLGIDEDRFKQLVDESKEHIRSGDVF